MIVVEPGLTLDRRYLLGRRLGSGGFGDVYAATDVATGRALAIKLLALRPGPATRRERMLREARLAASVANDHITQVFDAGFVGDVPYLVMELLEGEDLGRRLQRQGAFSRDETALFLLHVARALTAAHAEGIIHLDLKPRNMFLTRGDEAGPRVKLLDFGTAKLMETSPDDSSSVIAGTPIYMAPEQFLSADLGPHTDVFAFGMSAFHMLVGSAYFALEQKQTPNPFSLGALLMKGAREPASSRAARYEGTLSESFDAWFARCTHTDPKRRFSSAERAHRELLNALEVDDERLEAIEVSLPELDEPERDGAMATATVPTRPLVTNETAATALGSRRVRRALGAGLVVATALAAIGVAAPTPQTLSPPVVHGVLPPDALLDDPAVSSPLGRCHFGYSWSDTEAHCYAPELDGRCEETPFSPLVIIVHDRRRFAKAGFGSYRYLQKHLARNGFISLSLQVGEEEPAEAAETALAFMESFVAMYWPRTGSVDTESVALIGHGRGASTVRHLADHLVDHPIFDVRTIVSMAATGEGPRLEARHAEALLRIDVPGVVTPRLRDALPWTRKVIVAGTARGFADGQDAQNRLVQGYALAFLAAHHQGETTWHERFIAGDEVPAVATHAVRTERPP